MRSLSRVALFIAALSPVAGCERPAPPAPGTHADMARQQTLRDSAPAVAAARAAAIADGRRDGKQYFVFGRPVFDTAAVIATRAGCYELRTTGDSYVVRLAATRSEGEWVARVLEQPNTGGNRWSWVPVDSTHFVVNWGGIHGASSYAVEWRGDRFAAQETFYDGNAETQDSVPAHVMRVNCRRPPANGR